jgi:hypothetical protein
MGRIACRNPECDALRSDTVVSSDGSHIPPCHVCKDPGYIEPFDKELVRDLQVEMAHMLQEELDRASGILINNDPVQAYVKQGDEFVPVDDAGIRQLMRGYATRLGAIEDHEDVYIRLDGEWRLLSKGIKSD